MNIEQLKSTRRKDPNYDRVHQWIIRHHGNATLCENNSSHISKRYEWSNQDGVYKRDLKHFKQLCLSCHRKMDCTEKTRLIKSLQAKNQTHSRIPVYQLTLDGRLILRHISITHAQYATSILKTSIVNCLKGRTKQAGGYKWSYKEVTL